jgi:uncharacterized DUF497 family protein
LEQAVRALSERAAGARAMIAPAARIMRRARRLVVVGYTPRGADRHIFSMRKANRREQARLAPYFEIGS